MLLDELTEAVVKDQENPESYFHESELGKRYIDISSDIVDDQYFESGVVKIQQNLTSK